MVILPLGISVSTMSSGNSTSCRMTNSRNSFIRQKLTTNEHGSTRISFRLEALAQTQAYAPSFRMALPLVPMARLQPERLAPALVLARGQLFLLPQRLLFSPQPLDF